VQPFADIAGLLERARREPGRIGTGSTEALSAFIGQELARRAGVDMPDIQYRSGGPLMNDIVAGHLPVGWTSTASATPHMQTGRVRVLATSGPSRTPFFPDAPTLAEAGIPGIALSGWVALLGPPACPRPWPGACTPCWSPSSPKRASASASARWGSSRTCAHRRRWGRKCDAKTPFGRQRPAPARSSRRGEGQIAPMPK
ncbi:MAG: hypothetical protein ICV73_26000, partial [Acetobacteraceae bacterium]|nr:hypothetical protein [Acetobacteraceae bacterium]